MHTDLRDRVESWGRLNRALFGACCLVLVAGCAGEQLASKTPDDRRGNSLPRLRTDACALVTTDQAAAILETATVEESSFDGGTSCSFAGTAEGEQRVLTVAVRRGEVQGDAARGFDLYGREASVLDGIGDRAYVRSNEINVLTGETWLHLFTSTDTAPEDALVEAAKSAVERLPAATKPAVGT